MAGAAKRVAERYRRNDCGAPTRLCSISWWLRRRGRDGRNGVRLEIDGRSGGVALRAMGAVELSPHAGYGAVRVSAVLRRPGRRAALRGLLRTDVHFPR